jgi:Na+/H+-dicarboxylate symporter
MIFSKFEKSVAVGVFGAWIQLLAGYPFHALFSLGVFIVVILLGMLEYIRIK